MQPVAAGLQVQGDHHLDPTENDAREQSRNELTKQVFEEFERELFQSGSCGDAAEFNIFFKYSVPRMMENKFALVSKMMGGDFIATDDHKLGLGRLNRAFLGYQLEAYSHIKGVSSEKPLMVKSLGDGFVCEKPAHISVMYLPCVNDAQGEPGYGRAKTSLEGHPIYTTNVAFNVTRNGEPLRGNETQIIYPSNSGDRILNVEACFCNRKGDWVVDKTRQYIDNPSLRYERGKSKVFTEAYHVDGTPVEALAEEDFKKDKVAAIVVVEGDREDERMAIIVVPFILHPISAEDGDNNEEVFFIKNLSLKASMPVTDFNDEFGAQIVHFPD